MRAGAGAVDHAICSVLLDCKIFLTAMAKVYMALIDPTGNPVPMVRQGTLVYKLTPTVIPRQVPK